MPRVSGTRKRLSLKGEAVLIEGESLGQNKILFI
jgi:hypothetical protein